MYIEMTEVVTIGYRLTLSEEDQKLVDDIGFDKFVSKVGYEYINERAEHNEIHDYIEIIDIKE